MKQLYFMRHGLSEMNMRGLFSGRVETPLSKQGKLQCQQASLSLKGVDIRAIVCSPMERAYESALIVAQEIKFPKDQLVVNDLFMERDLGVLEGTKYIRGKTLNNVEGMESAEHLVKRAKEGLAFLESLDSDSILLVSHSAIGRALRYVIDPNMKFDEIESFGNAKIVRLI